MYRRRRRGTVRRKLRPRTVKYATVSPQKSISFPQQKLVYLKYCDDYNVTTVASGGTAYRQFAPNNPHDIDLTGTGHQPYGWDQLKTVYRDFLVLGHKTTVRFQNTTSTDEAVQCVLYQRWRGYGTSHVPDANIGTIMESQRGPSCTLQATSQKPSESVKVLSVSANTSKMCKMRVGDLGSWYAMTGNIGDAPTCDVYACVGSQRGYQGIVVRLQVEIRIICLVKNLLDLGQS